MNQLRLVQWLWAAAALVGAASAQTPVTLPVTDLALYTSGIGVFQHEGAVTGDAIVELRVERAHMDDLLQSLVVQDASGGRIDVIRYGARDPLERLLPSYALDLSGAPTLAELLAQARGEGASVTWLPEGGPTSSAEGAIVGVEREAASATQEARTFVTIATATGLRRIDLAAVVSIAFTRPDLQAELSAALAAIARHRSDDVAVVAIRFAGEGTRSVRLAYVREMPIWKATYRLSIGSGDDAELQGWAILDNPTAQDLDGVRLTFIAGQPISFTTDLAESVYVPRPRVTIPRVSAAAPKVDEGAMAAEASRAMAFAASPAPMVAEAFDGGLGGGVEAVAQAGAAGASFAYRVIEPVQVGRYESAAVPILTTRIAAEAVSWFVAGDGRANPLRAVRVTNDTGLHLPAGPVTLFDAGGFAGQALLADLIPGDARMLSYAVDLDVAARTDASMEAEEVLTAVLRAGLLESTWRSRARDEVTLELRGQGARTVWIDVPRRAGFEIVSPAAPIASGDAWRFAVRLGDTAPAAHGSCPTSPCTLEIVHERIDRRTIAMTNARLDQVAFIMQNATLSDRDRADLERLLALQSAIAAADREAAEVSARENAVFRDQERIRSNLAVLAPGTALHDRYLTDLAAQETLLTDIRARAEAIRAERERTVQEREALLARLGW